MFDHLQISPLVVIGRNNPLHSPLHLNPIPLLPRSVVWPLLVVCRPPPAVSACRGSD